MLLSISGLGSQKIRYKNHEEIAFLTLDDYLLLAKKAISKFGNSFFIGLSKKMLKDEDAISSIANAIMMADWRWDENYQNKQGTKKNKYSYRNQCALWAMQTYVTKIYKKPKKIKQVYSLDHNYDLDNDMCLHETIFDDTSVSADNLVMQEEYHDMNSQFVEHILSLNCLSDRQKEYIRLYYLEGHTFAAIGKKYGITREAIRQSVNKAISNIREIVNA